MSERGTFHVFRLEGSWALRVKSAELSTTVGLTKREAWAEARRLARAAGGIAYLSGKCGRIKARNDYGTH